MIEMNTFLNTILNDSSIDENMRCKLLNIYYIIITDINNYYDSIKPNTAEEYAKLLKFY